MAVAAGSSDVWGAAALAGAKEGDRRLRGLRRLAGRGSWPTRWRRRCWPSGRRRSWRTRPSRRRRRGPSRSCWYPEPPGRSRAGRPAGCRSRRPGRRRPPRPRGLRPPPRQGRPCRPVCGPSCSGGPLLRAARCTGRPTRRPGAPARLPAVVAAAREDADLAAVTPGACGQGFPYAVPCPATQSRGGDLSPGLTSGNRSRTASQPANAQTLLFATHGPGWLRIRQSTQRPGQDAGAPPTTPFQRDPGTPDNGGH